MRKAEYEQKRQQYEASRKIKRKGSLPAPGAALVKKKRKPKTTPGGQPIAEPVVPVPDLAIDGPKKRNKKAKVSHYNCSPNLILNC